MTKPTAEYVRQALPPALFLIALPAFGATCDLTHYTPQPGLAATAHGNTLELTWTGERSELLKATFTIQNTQPAITELSARKPGGPWIVLGQDLTPEFQVVTGKRRLSEQQMAPMRELGIAFTPEVVNREKW